MKRCLVFLLLLASTLFAASKEDLYLKGIIYYLSGDMEIAKRNFDQFFLYFLQPRLRNGCQLLLENKKVEAVNALQEYVESQQRTLEGSVALSLAVSDMENSTAMENLGMALRLNPSFTPALLCQGYEYLKLKDFVTAEQYFQKVLRLSDLPDVRIPVADFYLKSGQAQKAYDLIREDANVYPGNFYFNYLLAKACLNLNKITECQKYLEQALKIKPSNSGSLFLQAQYLIKQGEYKRAKSLLEGISFPNYNLEYSLTMAEILVHLGEKKAGNYLYEVFKQDRWQPRVNLLFGLYFMNKKDANVQNWITRAALSGIDAEELKKEFPSQFRWPSFNSIPLASMKKIAWLANNMLLAAGALQNGGKENLIVIQTNPLKVVKTFPYEGEIIDLVVSPLRNHAIFSTQAVANQAVYVYAFWRNGANFIMRPIVGHRLEMVSILAGFDSEEKNAFITDGSISDMAFESPFSVAFSYGRTKPVYPSFPFPAYCYNFATDTCTPVRGMKAIREVPITAVKKYVVVADAHENNSEVKALISKGMGLDIAASERVSIYFSVDISHFIIYHATLQNPFQALIFNSGDGSTKVVKDQSFLGDKNPTDLRIFKFLPERQEIYFITKDKKKALLILNYGTFMYKTVTADVLDATLEPSKPYLYVLRLKEQQLYNTESVLETISFSPYLKTTIKSRQDLEKFSGWQDGRPCLNTYNGELVRLNEDDGFDYLGPDFQGALYAYAGEQRQLAVFINGKLYFIPQESQK